MKKLLLILLCLPMIGFGQTPNKETIIMNLQNVIDSLEMELHDCEVFLELETENDCCQAGYLPVDSITYWKNGNKKELGAYNSEIFLEENRYKPLREWHKNGKIKKIYVYGGCECYHELSEIICFDRNTREIECQDD